MNYFYILISFVFFFLLGVLIKFYKKKDSVQIFNEMLRKSIEDVESIKNKGYLQSEQLKIEKEHYRKTLKSYLEQILKDYDIEIIYPKNQDFGVYISGNTRYDIYVDLDVRGFSVGQSPFCGEYELSTYESGPYGNHNGSFFKRVGENDFMKILIKIINKGYIKKKVDSI
jgi:hypothetical protein